MAMNQTISKLAEIDPVFREVVSKLYPAADPRELWDLSKSMPDQSAVHAPGQKKDGNKKALAGGLLFGTAAEGMAVRSAFGHAKASPMKLPPHPSGLKGSLKAVKAAHGPKAELGIQAVNMAVGLGAARELLKKPKQQGLSKSEFMEAVEPIIKARREGVITTEKALSMIEDIEKGEPITSTAVRGAAVRSVGHIFDGKGNARTGFKSLQRVADSQKQFVNKPRAEEFRAGVNDSVKHGRRAVAGTAIAGTAAVGYTKGKNKAKQEVSVMKSEEDSSDYEFSGEISKTDTDKRQVFGWCSLSKVDGKDVVDLQNDMIAIEEIEKSAYEYVRSSRKGGRMHARVGDQPEHVSDMIESVVVTPEKLRNMGVPEESISKVHTGWWVGFAVNDDDTWQQVKDGKLRSFSVHGKGVRKDAFIAD